MKTIPLSEGAFTIDASKKLIPFNPLMDDFKERTKGSLLVEIQPFAIITSKDIIVIDTGLGLTQPDGTLQIHKNLLDIGIGSSEVSKVLLSHLHKDHAGGIGKEDRSLKQKFISFPNAKYYVNREEFDFAMSIGRYSYATAGFDILDKSDNVIFTKGDGVIDGYIRYAVSGAHCPFHQVFWIEDNGQKLFYGGDVAPQLQQMKSRFIAKYDYDGKKCMELRQQWWKQGKEEKWTFLFYHDIKTPVYQNF